ncbi:interferon-induced protein 44-like [Engraulis encrasicolus]|uniref:interferon-induced protein 44-like n=1 Tax=Engraulis encrasicolus TaxID=184585 RepID=UPI002FD3CB04
MMGSSYPKPAFESYIYNKSVKRGEDITLSLKTNVDYVEVRWSKDGQTLYSGGRVEISKSGTDLTLKIRNAREEDEGKYTVRISYGGDSASDSANITMLEYDRDWRRVDWRQNDVIKNKLLSLSCEHLGVKQVRLLLHGPVGSGKSSLINSINSVFLGRVAIGALAESSASTSFTTHYKTYQIRDRRGRPLPFVFNDIMGLESRYDEGVHPHDIVYAIKGHIKDNYRFNPVCPLSSTHPHYNSSPSLSDKVHCLISVVAGDKISLMDGQIIQKMREIRMHASELGIPQVVFMTHVDMACSLVHYDLKHVYSSKSIRKKMQECSVKLGVPLNCIYPIKNYHEENRLDNRLDSLILDALTNAVNFAFDFVSFLDM